jgi:hypothetical protein
MCEDAREGQPTARKKVDKVSSRQTVAHA